MFADDSSTIITSTEQIRSARENILIYKKASCSELHEGKTIIIKLGKAQQMKLTQRQMQVKFSIMKENETGTYLGDVISNNISKEQTYNKALNNIEKLGEKWIKENIGIHGRTIVANTLLIAKLSHRASVNGISKTMKIRILKTIKEFIWGG